MLPLVAAALMAAMSAVKGANDEGRASNDRWLNAQIARYSPWTGQGQKAVRQADILGTTLQGAAAGYAMGKEPAETSGQSKNWDELLKQSGEVGPMHSPDDVAPIEAPGAAAPAAPASSSSMPYDPSMTTASRGAPGGQGIGMWDAMLKNKFRNTYYG